MSLFLSAFLSFCLSIFVSFCLSVCYFKYKWNCVKQALFHTYIERDVKCDEMGILTWQLIPEKNETKNKYKESYVRDNLITKTNEGDWGRGRGGKEIQQFLIFSKYHSFPNQRTIKFFRLSYFIRNSGSSVVVRSNTSVRSRGERRCHGSSQRFAYILFLFVDRLVCGIKAFRKHL